MREYDDTENRRRQKFHALVYHTRYVFQEQLGADGISPVTSAIHGSVGHVSIIQYRISFHLPVLFMEVVVEPIHFMGVVLGPILSIE